MTGYVRTDSTNNIADGNIINAADLDNEFDGVQAAFNASTGHTHDGTAAEGAPITKIGPAQDVIAGSTALYPKTTNTVDLGSSTYKYKDLYIAGTATIPTLNATTLDITTIEVTNLKAKDGTAAATIADSTGVVTIGSAVLTTADINGGTADGVIIGGSTAAAGSFTTVSASSQITSTVSTGTAPLVVASTTKVSNLNADLLDGADWASPAAIGSTAAAAGSFTTLSATGQITSTVSTGTAPLVVASTTKVSNLNVDLLDGADWASPAAIGSTAAAAGSFTTLSATGQFTSTVSTGTAPLVIASTTKVSNLNVDLLDGADWASPAAIGSTAAAAGSFTTLSASSTLAVTGVATFTAQPIMSSLTASKAVFSDGSKGLVSNDITGTGNVVMSNSPTLVTPALGTPSSATLTNATGLPVSTGISGLGTGVATALAVNTGSDGAFVVFNGALGTPTSGTVTNLTGTASININGTVGATTPTTGAFTSVTASADSTFSSTGALTISKGTTGQQPGSPVTGMMRYNTSTNQFEGYSGSSPSWKSIGGSALTNDTSTSSNLYPVFAASTSGTAENLYTSNALYLYKPSTGELSVKAPVASNGIFVNNATVSSDYTVASGTNGFSVGPMTVSSGVTVTVASGQQWIVI